MTNWHSARQRQGSAGTCTGFDGADAAICGSEDIGIRPAPTFHLGDFTIRADGMCRLNPEMAPTIVGVSLVKSRSEKTHSKLRYQFQGARFK